MMEILSCLKTTMEDALRSIAEKKNVSPSDIETATKAMCALEQIKMLEDGYSGSSHARMMRVYEGMSNTSPHAHCGGYSGHSIKDRMVAKLEEMYDQAQSDHEKQVVDEWIAKIEGQK